jgi:hypothetical protein
MGLPSFNPETYELSLLYARAVDQGDPSIFDRIFTEDAVLIYEQDVYSGREEIKRTTEVARCITWSTISPRSTAIPARPRPIAWPSTSPMTRCCRCTSPGTCAISTRCGARTGNGGSASAR